MQYGAFDCFRETGFSRLPFFMKIFDINLHRVNYLRWPVRQATVKQQNELNSGPTPQILTKRTILYVSNYINKTTDKHL